MEQVIKLTGRIAKVFPANSGVSQRTGNQWMSQEYLLEFFSWSGAHYPDRVVFRIFGEDRIKQFNLKELEDNVTVYLRMDAHESNGRWFNEISATNIVREGQQPAEAPAPQSDTQKQEETTNNGEKNDDLPF